MIETPFVNRSLRIIVADHQPDMQEFYRRMLPQMGHELLFVAQTGQELIEQCSALRPDLVITDIRMPDMDALDAAEQVYCESHVPVIILTAEHRPDQIERAATDHVFAYLIKPIGRVQLEAEIPIVVQRFQQYEALRKQAESGSAADSETN